MKTEPVSTETTEPRKRRTRAAEAEAEATDAPPATARRRTRATPKAETDGEPTPAPARRGRPRKTAAAAEQAAATEAAAPATPPATKAAPSAAPSPAPTPEAPPTPAPAVAATPAATPAPTNNVPQAPEAAQAGDAPAEAPQKSGGRGRHRQQRNQQNQQSGNQQAGQPQQARQQQPGQQQGNQNQPGQGSGRSRRRRRRGRGGPNAQPGAEVQLQPVEGILEIDEKGNGRIRATDKNFLATDNDPEVPKQVVERYRLRPGVLMKAGALTRNAKLVVQRVDEVEGLTPEEASNRLAFMNLTVIDPERRIALETTSGEALTRVIDIVAPIGFGQRALIVAPPKTGKTIILQKIAKAVLTNYPKAKLMVLLIDERPEEVTDFRRTIGAEVFGSSSDRPAYEHLRLAELVMERARRMVEAGEDVVVLLDSITRLARAYNKEIDSSGRTLSGGVDSRALERPKRLFGAARNTEEAGSLTIVGTALIDTGSRMDEVIFEEFKGTGNMEIVLDRQLAERRLFPAINVNNSGTRKEEKLFDAKENEKIRKLRQFLSALRPVDAMEKLLSRLRDFRSNAEFFDAL